MAHSVGAQAGSVGAPSTNAVIPGRFGDLDHPSGAGLEGKGKRDPSDKNMVLGMTTARGARAKFRQGEREQWLLGAGLEGKGKRDASGRSDPQDDGCKDESEEGSFGPEPRALRMTILGELSRRKAALNKKKEKSRSLTNIRKVRGWVRDDNAKVRASETAGEKAGEKAGEE